MAVLRFPTLNKSLNDEKKLAETKDNKNKLVIEFRMLVSTFLMSTLKNDLLPSFVFKYKPTRGRLRYLIQPQQRHMAPFFLSVTRCVLASLFPGTVGTNIRHCKLEKMGSENGTCLRFTKDTIYPARNLAQSLQGEKGVDRHWQFPRGGSRIDMFSLFLYGTLVQTLRGLSDGSGFLVYLNWSMCNVYFFATPKWLGATMHTIRTPMYYNTAWSEFCYPQCTSDSEVLSSAYLAN